MRPDPETYGMRIDTIHGIKNFIPSDSKSHMEEDEKEIKKRKQRETFDVLVHGLKCDSISREVFAHETHVKYGGLELQIQGSGYERFVSLTGIEK